MTFASLVLAAGAGRRFGGDKLSAPFRGEPLIRHAIRAARAAPVGRVIVVSRAGLDIGEWPGGPRMERIALDSASLSDTLKAGIVAAQDAAGVFVFLGDMPLVPHEVAGKLAQKLVDNHGGAYAAVPRFEGRAGHPVLLCARAYPDMMTLDGDRGAGPLLNGRDDVAFVDVNDEAILIDIDRREELAALEKRAGEKRPGIG